MEQFKNIQDWTTENYTVPENAIFFHSIPRLSVLSFKPVSSKFDLQIADYQLEANPYLQSLLFYPACCALLLVLSILITGIISCCMCCRPPPETKSTSLNSRKFFIGLFATFIIMLCVVGGYGNYQCAEGVNDLVESSQNVSTHVKSIQNEIVECESKVKNTLESLNIMSGLLDLMGQYQPSPQVVTAQEKVNNASDRAAELKNQLDGLGNWRVFNHRQDMAIVDSLIVQLEFIRSVCTYSLLGFCGFVAFVVLLSVLCSSEVFLMIGAVTGIFGLISAFLLSAWYLTFAMGVSDFCMEPYEVMYNNSDFSRNDMSYFLHCPEDHSLNPYHSKLQTLFDKFREGEEQITSISSEVANAPEVLLDVEKMLKEDFYDVKASLQSTQNKAECTVVHSNYVAGLNAVCYTFLEGIDFIFGAGLLCAFCMFILVILAACTWGQMEKQAEYCASSYDPLDDPYRRTGSSRDRYGMYAGDGPNSRRNYSRVPALADHHQPPPSYHI